MTVSIFHRAGRLLMCALTALLSAVPALAQGEALPGGISTTLSLPARADVTPAALAPTPTEVPDDNTRIPTIDLTAPVTDLWQRIRNGFGMPDLIDPTVTSRQAWYLNRPDYLRATLARSRKYLYHIVDELEKRGMPTELALLPFVESSFNPQAHSPARALGMWQFIPSTGKNYKLEQNWWMDERRDIIASTNAALEYLQNIYEINGDWHLALASYNWGEGAVARAMAKNAAKGLPSDYLSLTMPAETRYYVPKLQALKNIVADPELFNFTLDPIPNRPYFATVEIDRNMDVSVAARLADISLNDFIALNPAYSRPVIPGNSDNPLVIPADKLSTFMANLEQYESSAKPLSNWVTYRLKPREKLDAVAARHGISGAKLRQLNGITRRTRVAAGMMLLVPGRNAYQPEAVAAALPKTPSLPAKAKAKSRAKGKAGKTKAASRKAAPRAKKTAMKTTSKTSAKARGKSAPARKKPAPKKG